MGVPELALELHNGYRKKHGVSPVTVDEELCRIAEKYARCISKKRPVNIDLTNLGVNMYEMKISRSDGNSPNIEMAAVRQAMKTWYSQIRDYDWQDPMDSPVFAENFYEIVWKATCSIGVAVESRDELIFVVVIYSRDGKDMTTSGHKENVFPG